MVIEAKADHEHTLNGCEANLLKKNSTISLFPFGFVLTNIHKIVLRQRYTFTFATAVVIKSCLKYLFRFDMLDANSPTDTL